SLPGVDGDVHYKLRKILQRPYSRASLLNHVPQAASLAEDVLRRERGGGPVPVVPLMRRIVTDQLGTLLLGRSVGDYLDDIGTTLRYSLNCTVTMNWPQVMLRLPNYRRAKARMLELGREVLRGSDKPVDRRSDLLAELRKATEEDPNLLSPEDLRMAAMGPFVAGLDTVSNSCAFLLYALLNAPEAYRRVTADADRLFADGGPTAERLQDLPALRGAVQEALRLYPIAPVLVRHVRQPFEFGGYRLETGESVLIASTIVHFLEELFPDPYKFDIDRHQPTPGRKPAPLAGFGLGPHTCLGSGFAEEQMALVIATLLHHARFSLVPAAGRPTITRDPSPTLGPRYTVRLDGFRRAHAKGPPVAA
ncbi:MAG TPA: cytochrome P450, partial [Nannocystis sp.]